MCEKMMKCSKTNLRDKQAAETKEKLIKAAVELFLEQGYEATSVRTINRKAGVADGLLYHYFSGGKKELFHDVVECHVKKVIDDVAKKGIEANYEAMPLDEALEMHFCNVLDIIEKHIDVFRMVCKENALREIITTEEIDHLLNHSAFQFSEVLQKKIEAGEIKNIDVCLAGQSIGALVMSHVFCRVLDLPGHQILDPAKRKDIINYYLNCWS